MATSKPAPMRGTGRTLAVLRALNADNPASAGALAAATGISRPAVYRILDALCLEGYVQRLHDGERYELTSLVRSLSDGYKEDDWILAAAAPVMQHLQREIVWPTDLASFRDNAMYLRETTRGSSPLTIDGVLVGTRLPMLSTASGRAYLCWCGEKERKTILENLRHSGRPEDLRARDTRYVSNLLAATLKQGYGERGEELFPKTSAIAIPLRIGDRLPACLNITFIASVLTPKEAARRYLKPMREAAAEIESQARS